MVSGNQFLGLFVLCLPMLLLADMQNAKRFPRPGRDENAADWSYNDIEGWGDAYPICNNGRNQSPIALTRVGLQNVPIAGILYLFYDEPLEGRLILTNNGHSVNLAITETKENGRPMIYGGILEDSYEAISLHFHWGSPNSKGSEHTIDGRRYDVEMHIVHRNINYNTSEEAYANPDGLAVLAVMLQIVESPNRFYPGLKKIFNKLPAVTRYASQASLNGQITMEQMLGDIKTQQFYTYRGSLTTPPCAEAVTFIVFPDVLPIARERIALFWNIRDRNGNRLLNNYRPLQQRNKRPVFYHPDRRPFVPFLRSGIGLDLLTEVTTDN